MKASEAKKIADQSTDDDILKDQLAIVFEDIEKKARKKK